MNIVSPNILVLFENVVAHVIMTEARTKLTDEEFDDIVEISWNPLTRVTINRLDKIGSM